MKRNKSPFSPFVELFMEENPDMEIIDHCEDSVLARNTETFEACFAYEVNSDMSYSCNLFSEVGRIYTTWFEQSMEKNKITMLDGESEKDVFNILIKEGEVAPQ